MKTFHASTSRRPASSSRRQMPRICSGSIALALLAMSPAVHGVSDSWTGTNSPNWADTLNWLGGNIPGTGNTATFNDFGVNTTLTLGTITIANLLFDTASAGLYTIGSGLDTLTLNGGGSVAVTATVFSNEIIGANVVLGNTAGDQTFTFTNDSAVGGQSLSFTSSINSTTTGNKTLLVNGAGVTSINSSIGNTAGTVALTKDGTGTLALTGLSTYTGKTTVNGGTLSFDTIGDVGAGGSALGAPTSAAAGTIDLAGTLLYTGLGSTSNRVINLTNAAGVATINNSGFGDLILTGGITGGSSNIIFRGAGNIIQSGLITNSNGTGLVSHTDGGTLFLTNAANSFAGSLNIATGTIDANSIANSGLPSAIGAGTTISLGQQTTLPNATFAFSGLSGGSTNRAISLTRGSGATATTWTIFHPTAGQTLTLNGNVTLANPAGGTGVMTLALAGDGNGVLGGSITGAPALSLTKSGLGTWTLSTANTYTGNTNLTAGVLKLGNASALGASRVNIAGGSTLDLNGHSISVPFINNFGALSGGVIDNVSAGGTVTLTVGSGVGGVNATSANYQANDIFSGVIANSTGVVNLVKVSPTVANQFVGIMATASQLNGPNVLRLTNQNTYSGTTTIKGGILNLNFGQLNNGGAAVTTNILPTTTTVILEGGDLILDALGGITGTQTVTGVTLNAGASHIGSYRSSSQAMTLNLGAMTRSIGSSLDLLNRPSGSSSNARLGAADGAVVSTTTANANFAGGSASILGGYATFNGNTWAVSASNGVAAGNITALAAYNAGFAATTNVDAAIGISAPAAMTINSLRFNTAGAYTVNTAGDLTVATGGILVTPTVGANAVALNNNNLTSNNGTDLIVIQNNANAAGNFTIGSNITGAIGLTKSGRGTLTLTPNAANTFTGELNINGGTVILGNANALNTTTPVAVNFGGTSQTIGGNPPVGFFFINGALNLNGNNATVASIKSNSENSGTAIVQNASGTPATITINGSISTNFAGIVQDGTGGGALSVTKAGSSTLTLQNTNYTGNTTVNGGTLVVKTNINASPLVTVGTGAVLDVTAVAGGLNLGSTKTLAGTGSVIGGVTISTGANLSPGAPSTVGTLTLDNVTLATGSVLSFNLNSGVSTDFVNVTSTNGLTINGGGFALSGAAVGATGTTFNLFQYVGAIQGIGTTAFSVLSGGIGGLTYTFGDDTVNKYVTLTISGTAAQTAAWGVNANGSWGLAGNWSPNVVPQNPGDTANFAGAILTPRTVSLNGSRSVGAMNFDNANAYTIDQGSGGTLRLDNGASAVNVSVLSGSHTISAPVTLVSNTLLGVTNTGDTFTVSGAVDGAGSLTKSGNGTLVLSTANSYTGGTAVSAGTLDFVTGGLGTTGTIIFGGGTLRYAAGNTDDLSARTVNFAGQARIDTNGNAVSYLNPVGAGGAGGVTKLGAGLLTLSAGNTFTGASIIKAGTLAINADTSLGAVPGVVSTNLSFDPGIGNSTTLQADNTFALNFNRNVSLLSGTAIFDPQISNLTVNGAISGTGLLKKVGVGTLTLSSGASNYSGGTQVDDGTLAVTSGGNVSGALGTGAVTLNNSAILNLGNRNLTQPLVVNGTNGLLSGDGGGASALNVVSGAGTLNVTITGANVDLRGDMSAFTGTIANSGGGTFRLNGTTGSTATTFDLGGIGGMNVRNATTLINLGALSGSAGSTLGGSSNNATALVYSIGAKNLDTEFGGVILNGGFAGTTTGITKVGTGILTISGFNTYTGLTTATQGTLIGTTDSSFGDSLAATAGLNFNPVISTTATARFLSLTPFIASLASSGAGTSSVVLGDGTLGTPTTLTLGGNGATTVYSGSISDQTGANAAAIGSLIKDGIGMQTLAGTNTYKGTTTVVAGTLQFASQASLYNNTPASWTFANITVNSGATLGLNVGGAGQFTAANVTQILSLGTNLAGFTSGSFAALDTTGGDFSYGTAIADTNVSTNVLGLKKTGINKLTLTAASTYSGGTAISGGILNVNADSALGASIGAVEISNAAALQTDGTLSTTRTVTLGTGGGYFDTNGIGAVMTLSAASTVNGTTLTKTGDGTLNLNGTQTYNALTTSTGTTNVNSPLGTGTATVNANALTNFSVSQTLAALNIGASGTVVLTASPSPEDGMAFSNEMSAMGATSGSQVAAVPEPGAIALLAFGALGILARRRRA